MQGYLKNHQGNILLFFKGTCKKENEFIFIILIIVFSIHFRGGPCKTSRIL